MTHPRLPVLPTLALGVLTIVAFGAWFYGYGVLVEPIGADTGWNETTLGGTYGASLLLTGIAGLGVGRLLDHRGTRATFLGLGVGSGGLLLVASTATNPAVFAVSAALGGGLVGAGGYYNATSAVMARLAPDHRALGITRLTLFGALASPVFLPVMAAAVEQVGWRSTLRGAAVVVAASYVWAAVGVPDLRPDAPERPRLLQAARDAVASGPRRQVVIAATFVSATTSIVLVQQVPVMVDAGLVLSVASGFAGARGFLQLAGRLPLPPVIARLGARRTLRASYALTVVASVLLIGAGTWLQAGLFAVVGGVAIGALAAVESIRVAEVYDGATMATLMGVFGLLKGLGASVGPTVAGALVDATGSRTSGLLLAAGCAAVGAALLRDT